MTPRQTRRRSVPVLPLAAVAALLGSAFSGCTKHDGLILLDLRSSGPYGAPVASIRLSAKGWTTRDVSLPAERAGSIGPTGFRIGYYGPADGSPVTVTAEARDGVDCVLGKGSGTVTALAAGATSDPITVFVRPVAGNDCTVVDAGTDAGGEDAGADAGSDAGDDAGTDATADAGTDAGVDGGADASDDAGTDAADDSASDATAD